jgi:cell division transport system permease protein
MKNIFKNTGYFLKETFVMIRLSLLSNTLSLFSTGLIFFILAMVLSGWWVSTNVADTIKGEAEISAYYNKSIDPSGALKLVEQIRKIEGVKNSRLVGEKEAYAQIQKVLGNEADILKVFDSNPFTSYIEININIDSVGNIIKELNHTSGIEYVRDNRVVLDRLENLIRLFMFIGYLVLAAAGISTLVIISHIIRLAIRDNWEQINTLRLLGAPNSFIALPFLLQGLLLTLGGGILASILAAFVLKQVYAQITGPLPFIPLPSCSAVISNMTTAIVSASAVLGILGSALGLSSSKSK